MRWVATLLMLMLCMGTASAQSVVGGQNFAKPSYANLTGVFIGDLL